MARSVRTQPSLPGRHRPTRFRHRSSGFDPYDPTLPTYSGHATVHTTNFENSPNAGFTNTVVLRGTDGSHVLLHQDVHILVKPSGIVLSVDHTHARCG
jgi:hypothetical protein